MKKLILITIFACAALWGCVHADNKHTDASQALMDARILDTRWKLVELLGKPVAADERFPFIQLHAKEGRISGFGGCNSIGGGYELKAGNRVRFTNLASTMMACPDMDSEQEFFNVLSKIGRAHV